MRVRGLKHPKKWKGKKAFWVAPRAGAWIETVFIANISTLKIVAPRAGAWIETCVARPLLLPPFVAPRAGAWIETINSPIDSLLC